jgi:hypothetical protein
MKLAFNFDAIDTTTFGVGKDNGAGQTYMEIPSDGDVQDALVDMARTTWAEMRKNSANPEKYDPSEKHSAIEHLYLPLNDDLSTAARELHEATNIPLDAQGLKDASTVFCYFARLTDTAGKHLTALRRATQFKGTLKSRLVQIRTNALKLVKEPIFRLDRDFDFLVDSTHVHILRPSGYEFAGKLQQAIMQAVPNNITKIQKLASFIDFGPIQAYAEKHPRAARHIASIQALGQCKNIEKRKVKKLCDATSVNYTEKDGKLILGDADIMGFLEVVDRRRYEVELISGSPEKFKASARQKIPA